LTYGFTHYCYSKDNLKDDTNWKLLETFDPHNGYFCPTYDIAIPWNSDGYCAIRDNLGLTWFLRRDSSLTISLSEIETAIEQVGELLENLKQDPDSNIILPLRDYQAEPFDPERGFVE